MNNYESLNNSPPYRGWLYEDEEANYTTAPMVGRPTSESSEGHQPFSGMHFRGYADLDDTFGKARDLDPLSPPVPTLPGPRPTRKRSRRVLRSFLLLSVFALLAGLVTATVMAGGRSFGQQLLSQTSTAATKQPTRAIRPETRATPVPPSQMQLPAAWTASGLGPIEAGEAELMAQGFVVRYQSIEGNNPQSLRQSLTNAEFILSRNALARFLGKVPGIPADPRATNSFIGVRQSAVIDAQPQLLSPQTVNGNFFALVVVPYQLTQIKNGQVLVTQEQMTVALAPIPYGGGGVPQSMGWVVVAWQPGNMPPPLPPQP